MAKGNKEVTVKQTTYCICRLHVCIMVPKNMMLKTTKM